VIRTFLAIAFEYQVCNFHLLTGVYHVFILKAPSLLIMDCRRRGFCSLNGRIDKSHHDNKYLFPTDSPVLILLVLVFVININNIVQ
jgi:hypothetical protein